MSSPARKGKHDKLISHFLITTLAADPTALFS
jgi:hypothetical protein